MGNRRQRETLAVRPARGADAGLARNVAWRSDLACSRVYLAIWPPGSKCARRLAPLPSVETRPPRRPLAATQSVSRRLDSLCGCLCAPGCRFLREGLSVSGGRQRGRMRIVTADWWSGCRVCTLGPCARGMSAQALRRLAFLTASPSRSATGHRCLSSPSLALLRADHPVARRPSSVVPAVRISRTPLHATQPHARCRRLRARYQTVSTRGPCCMRTSSGSPASSPSQPASHLCFPCPRLPYTDRTLSSHAPAWTPDGSDTPDALAHIHFPALALGPCPVWTDARRLPRPLRGSAR